MRLKTDFIKNIPTFTIFSTFEMLHMIWYHLYNLKNVKNTQGIVLLLVMMQASAVTLLKVALRHWRF